jgi:ribosomal protection tetracycline resistance protein
LNLGILAHVDAGKTTLTERLLYAAGVIDDLGSVDAGTTQTDSLDLERQRGITIKSAVVSFVVDDVTVNLIDTPGHPDFIAEVERVLDSLDGAVLVISAVEGVQAQTRVLMRTLQRLRVPTLLFVNKIDRRGADDGRVLQAIAERLSVPAVAMGSTRALGTPAAGFDPYGPGDAAFPAGLAEALVDDDSLLAAYVDDAAALSYPSLRDTLARSTRQGALYPVFCGSAITGAGVDTLMAAIAELLPGPQADGDGEGDGPPSGLVFKIERSATGEKVAFVRMRSGTLRTRDRVQIGENGEGKVTAIEVFDRGTTVSRPSVAAGEIAKLWGLGAVRIGDTVGPTTGASAARYFPSPTLETAIVASEPAQKGPLYLALTQLAEQDPLINLRQDDRRQELFVSLYGEVQKEVIRDTLAADFGIEVTFHDTTQICVERVARRGEALEVLRRGANPFLATVGFRLEPKSPGTGIAFDLDVEVGGIPIHVFKNVGSFRDTMEGNVRATLREGLYGWQVTDCRVTMTHSGYTPATIASDFRKLTPLVLMTALQRAGTAVCEPIHRFRLDGPAESLGSTLRVLGQLGAVPSTPTVQGSSFTLEGDVAAARMHDLQHQLRSPTHGEAVLEFAFDRHEAVRGAVPTRPRSDHNPLNRKEYLLHVKRRV